MPSITPIRFPHWRLVADDGLVQSPDWNAEHGDPAEIVDRTVVGHQREFLLHHKQSLDPITQDQMIAFDPPAHLAGGIAQCSCVFTWADGSDDPVAAGRWLAVKRDGLIEPEASIRLGGPEAFDVKRSGIAENEFQRTIALTGT